MAQICDERVYSNGKKKEKMKIDIIFMVIAVFLVILGICSMVIKVTECKKRKIVLLAEAFMIAIGLSYLIWFCN